MSWTSQGGNLRLKRKLEALPFQSQVSSLTCPDPCMSWTSQGGNLRLKRKSFKLPWKKQRVLLSRRKIRFFVHSLKCLRSDKRLIGEFRRKKKSLNIQERTTKDVLNLYRPPLRQKQEARKKLWE